MSKPVHPNKWEINIIISETEVTVEDIQLLFGCTFEEPIHWGLQTVLSDNEVWISREVMLITPSRDILDILTDVKIVSSRGEGKRFMKDNSSKFNLEKGFHRVPIGKGLNRRILWIWIVP